MNTYLRKEHTNTNNTSNVVGTKHPKSKSTDFKSESNPKSTFTLQILIKLECGPMPNLMAALPNIGFALYSTPQSLADAHY